ncbi:hypothetical protein BGZ94_008366 [Podila epigama]|nr:hypothetical protein BGZ94_008366 [Podila epigama]
MTYPTRPYHTHHPDILHEEGTTQGNHGSHPLTTFQARSQTHPAPSTSPRTGSTEARPLAVSNFQLLVHARHPVARGVASESLDFHQSLQSEHRIPSTIIPPLSVLHLLYSAIRQQDQLQYLTGSDWNMFLFWLSYHKDRTLFGQLRELLMGPMAIVPSQGRISEEALQILAPSRTQTKSRVKSTKNYGASVPGSSIQKTVTEYEPGVPPTVTTENFKIENQDHLNTVSPEQQAQQAHQAQQDLSSETVYASGSTPAKPKKRSRGNDSSEQSPLDFDSALASFRAALEGSRKPSIEVSNALLKGLVQKERLEEALALFRTLTEYHGVTPNEETFRHLMKVAAAYGHLAMARSIISSLNSLRVSLDGAIYRDLIKCYVRSGNLSGAIRMFERMGSGYINGEIRHINALLEGTTGGNHTMLYEVSLAGSKRPTTKVSPLTTLGILEVMAATGRRPNAKTWYHLLNGAFKVKDRIISQQLFMEMSREVAGHKGHQHQESSVDGKKTKQTQKSIPVVGHASRHPDTFLLLVEEYAKRYGVDPAANLLRGALDAEYPVWVNESLRQWLNGMNSEEN